MRSLRLRLLPASSLSLILPGGWCCMLAPLFGQGSGARAASVAAAECCCRVGKLYCRRQAATSAAGVARLGRSYDRPSGRGFKESGAAPRVDDAPVPGVQSPRRPPWPVAVMKTHFLHVLALASALHLALPPGWCSLVQLSHPETPEAPAGAHGGCCDLCGCKDWEKPPPPPSAPMPPPSRCCCYELNWLPPPHPEKVGRDHSLPALLPALIVPVAAGIACPEPDRTLHVPAPPLNLLHRVWLC
jgi:hypothetical protein